MSSKINLGKTIIATTYETRAEGCVERIIEYRTAGHQPKVEGTIRYEFLGRVLPLPLHCQDFVLVALLFFAMGKGLDLHIRGPVSKRLLANLGEFQRAWHEWLPKKYRPVKLTVDVELDTPAADDGTAVLAYSGGVDANFSLVRHLSKLAGRSSRQIKAAMLVHGFDIRLDQTALFDQAFANAQKILATFDLPLTVVRTDWKKSVGSDWEMEHGVALASCLFQFTGIAQTGLLASDHHYNELVFPWGSNLVTNPYLNGHMSLSTDGAGFTRSGKVAVIADFPVIRENLRVCYKRPSIDENALNCERCGKCLRTKMNFYANGLTPGKSLGAPLRLLDIVCVKADTSTALSFHLDILRTAKQNGITGLWVRANQAALFLNGAKVFLRLCLYRPLKKALWGRG